MSPRRKIMDSAVTTQLGFGRHSDPVTLSSEFKKYGRQVTGSPKRHRVRCELERLLDSTVLGDPVELRMQDMLVLMNQLMARIR